MTAGQRRGLPREVRIIGGQWKRSKLPVPDKPGLRPTPDRVRETLFNWLGHDLTGWHCVDAFAGTGALGLEALSRGARYCLFIEEDAAARAAIRRNVEALGLTRVTKIWRRDATKLGELGTLAPFDLVFLDPPYGRGLGEQSLAGLIAGGWLAPEAVVVLEEHADQDVTLPASFSLLDERAHGDTKVLIARVFSS